MRKTRKLFAIAALTALVAAACGGDDDTDDPADVDEATDDDESTDDEAADTDEPAGDDQASDDVGEDVGEDDGDDAEEEEAEASDVTLTVYSGRGEDLVAPILEQFSEATGIGVEVRYGSSAEMLLLLQQEGDNSPADVYYSQGAGFLGHLSEAGGLLELDDEILDQVPAALRSPNDDWVGLSGRARVVVYNTDELSESDLPDSILDFTDPEWNGRIGWAPTNASFQDFITAMRAIEGEDATREWLDGIVANGAVAYENNTGIVEGVAAGEVSVGLSNHYYLYRFIAEDPDYPVANLYQFGDAVSALVNIAGAGVIASTDHPGEAQALIEYLLSPEAQEYFAEETFEIPVVGGVATSADLPAIESLTLPDFDLNALLDLEGTVDLLIEVGVID